MTRTQKWYWIWSRPLDKDAFLEDLNRLVMRMCEASHFARWPDEMQDRPIWVALQYCEYRDERFREVQKLNKDAGFPIIPDWIT